MILDLLWRARYWWLVAVTMYVKHRSLTAASICGMLGMFQNDDAACRLIARLKKERDEAWSLLERQESINKL
ncbi:hypothetical protein CUMW_206520 [Citrus unshiu]|nr:hypothetical protein CUMW_206520 [Citrus unshiu]